jgi:hypothetical protein
MSLSRSRVRLAAALAAAMGAGYMAQGTFAAGDGIPADKAVAAGSKTVVSAPGENVEIMSATFKTSKPSDLLIGVSLECSILTDVVIEGGPSASEETTRAEGTVKVWVELDGKIVPIQDVSAPPQDPAASGNGDETDKVTFCDRLHERTVSDREEDADGLDGSRDYQRTKSANAFNWVRLNAGSGVHELVVKARLTVSAEQGSSAEAVIGNRSLVIEPTKLANDAVIAENGTS